MTFPGGTHDLWIRYWLAAGGIDPDKDVSTIVVPPPQMVANMKVGNMDAFCVGEPWNEQLVNQGIGFTACTTGEIWKKHPEKALGMRADWVDKNPSAAKALLMAVHGSPACGATTWPTRTRWPTILGQRQWFNVPPADILGRLKGDINYGDGSVATRHRPAMKFWQDDASYPFKSHDAWFLTENIRWGKFEADDRHQGAGRQGEPRGPLARRRQGAERRRRPTSRPRFARQGDLLRRQGLRSRQPAGLSRQPRHQARRLSGDCRAALQPPALRCGSVGTAETMGSLS